MSMGYCAQGVRITYSLLTRFGGLTLFGLLVFLSFAFACLLIVMEKLAVLAFGARSSLRELEAYGKSECWCPLLKAMRP